MRHGVCCSVSVNLTYILPIKKREPAGEELFDYLHHIAPAVELIVVDGSQPSVFARHASCCGATIRHVPVLEEWRDATNGKVAGVLTGLSYASHDAVVVADDDVRYEVDGLRRVAELLLVADVVRPQNYFDPLPWHALLDTGRSLLNRVSGGDWPGTLGLKASALENRRYAADVLFENLELVRTIQARGGVECCALDLFVRRLPPAPRHFWSQRVRQAYDEFARPFRMVGWLSIAPLMLIAMRRRRWGVLLAGAVGIMAAAELGRGRGGGRRFFPRIAVLLSPVWVVERTICAWLALGSACLLGGIPYHGRIVSKAATAKGRLRKAAAQRAGTASG
jgi:hypothetical protein